MLVRFRLCDISTSYPHGMVLGRCLKSTHGRMRDPTSTARRGDVGRSWLKSRHRSDLKRRRTRSFSAPGHFPDFAIDFIFDWLCIQRKIGSASINLRFSLILKPQFKFFYDVCSNAQPGCKAIAHESLCSNWIPASVNIPRQSRLPGLPTSTNSLRPLSVAQTLLALSALPLVLTIVGCSSYSAQKKSASGAAEWRCQVESF